VIMLELLPELLELAEPEIVRMCDEHLQHERHEEDLGQRAGRDDEIEHHPKHRALALFGSQPRR